MVNLSLATKKIRDTCKQDEKEALSIIQPNIALYVITRLLGNSLYCNQLHAARPVNADAFSKQQTVRKTNSIQAKPSALISGHKYERILKNGCKSVSSKSNRSK